MRFKLAMLCLTVALLPMQARAAQIDLNAETCQDFMHGSNEEMGYTLAWLDGYYKEADAPPIINFDVLKANQEKLSKYCLDHPDSHLGDAAADLFGQ